MKTTVADADQPTDQYDDLHNHKAAPDHDADAGGLG